MLLVAEYIDNEAATNAADAISMLIESLLLLRCFVDDEEWRDLLFLCARIFGEVPKKVDK